MLSNLSRRTSLIVQVNFRAACVARILVDLSDVTDAMNSLAFVGRVADELSSSSEFLSAIGCGHQVAEGRWSHSDTFDKLLTFHQSSVQRLPLFTLELSVNGEHTPSPK